MNYWNKQNLSIRLKLIKAFDSKKRISSSFLNPRFLHLDTKMTHHIYLLCWTRRTNSSLVWWLNGLYLERFSAIYDFCPFLSTFRSLTINLFMNTTDSECISRIVLEILLKRANLITEFWRINLLDPWIIWLTINILDVYLS